MKREVRFLDNMNALVMLKIEVREKNVLAISGERGGASGQMHGSIAPRNETHERLIDLWKQNQLTTISDEQIREINALCEEIERESGDYSAFLAATSIPEIDENINMGAEDFVPSRDIIEFVMDLRGCDEDEAKAFIALGMSLHLSVAELNSNFTVYDSDCCYYKAAGRSYYIGTEEMLKDALRAVMDENEDHYKWCWVEAVQAKRTELGFEDWFEEVIKNPQNELDAWDGCGDYQTIEDDEYCICRA